MTCNIIHHNCIYITSDQCLDSKSETIVSNQAFFTNKFFCNEVVGGRSLNTNHIAFFCNKFINSREAIFINTNHHTLCEVNITIREVNNFCTFFCNGDTIGSHVIFTVGHCNNHAVPACFDIFWNTVQTFADFADCIVIPAIWFTSFFINKVEWNIRIFYCYCYRTTLKVWQLVLCINSYKCHCQQHKNQQQNKFTHRLHINSS